LINVFLIKYKRYTGVVKFDFVLFSLSESLGQRMERINRERIKRMEGREKRLLVKDSQSMAKRGMVTE
jgi:hypothetical protein